MEEKTNFEKGQEQETQERQSAFDFAVLYRTIILNWYWFILSLVICGGLGAIYLRYATPKYQSTAKLLIKDDDSNSKRGQSLQNMTNLGIISNSAGIDNEMEILTSHSIAEDAIRDLKLYVDYSTKGRIKDIILYRDQPLNVDIDRAHLEKLNQPGQRNLPRSHRRERKRRTVLPQQEVHLSSRNHCHTCRHHHHQLQQRAQLT